MNLIETAVDYLTGRRQAYLQTFKPDGIHSGKVLADLSRFCRANEDTFHKDKRISERLAGRREVWLRINQHLNLTEEELWKLYNGE